MHPEFQCVVDRCISLFFSINGLLISVLRYSDFEVYCK